MCFNFRNFSHSITAGNHDFFVFKNKTVLWVNSNVLKAYKPREEPNE